MSNKKFIVLVFLVFICFVGIIGGINFSVDPGSVYAKKYSQNNAKAYAEKLFLSKNGLIANGWNERIVKSSLAKYSANFDCIVLGSSHIMQISQIRKVGNIQNVCPTLLNLGVSGGSIEDLTVFTSIILNNQQKPKKIFIGIDPWTFKFGMDERYKINQHYFDQLDASITKKKKDWTRADYELLLIKNLFNLQYFAKSLLEIKQGSSVVTHLPMQEPNTTFSYDNGYTEPVTLPDGSHVYESEWILKQKTTPIPIGSGDYKISGKAYTPEAVEYFKKIVQLYHNYNIEVNFLITPYHHNVFRVQSKAVEHMALVENLVDVLSKELSCPVFGSFYPHKMNCMDNEFYDFMHPTTECLDKIKFERF